MQLRNVSIDKLKRHPRYGIYFRKYPGVACYALLKNVLTKKGFLLLSRVQPISVLHYKSQSDQVENYQIISGIRTYWAAEKLKINEVKVILYDQEDLKSAFYINEMVDADVFLAVMPFLQHNSFSREFIKLSGIMPQGSMQRWFMVPKNQNILKTILPFSKSLIQKYLKND